MGWCGERRMLGRGEGIMGWCEERRILGRGEGRLGGVNREG